MDTTRTRIAWAARIRAAARARDTSEPVAMKTISGFTMEESQRT